ncbi:MAG: DUF4249 domain-containing protein [Sphingobacteriaceae bacterium]|nr:DUF4249 domain-containing protein [Cytophagaceae bacterium]
MKTGCILLPLYLLLACVEPYAPRGLNLEGEVLVVDANLTDQPEAQFVRLTRSLAKPFSEFTEEPLTGASVTVHVNDVPQTLREASPGRYEMPAGFVGKVGERFQLQFSTPAGQRYESGVETMQRVSKIEKAYDRFDAQAIANVERTKFTPAHLIYVDTQDPVDTRNFYRWTWTLWERQDYCASCQRSVLDGSRCGQNQFVPINYEPPFWWDYSCRTKCWDMLFSYDINVFSDRFTNGQPIVGRLAGQIPYYEARGALVEIRQQALTPEAYQYYQLFASQTQGNGGLADTPPAPLLGNVRNLDNPDEIISGYFTAGAVSKLRYWLDRKNVSGVPLGLFFTQNGERFAVPEPYLRTPFETRPPTARCLPGDTRTPNQPEGWLGP